MADRAEQERDARQLLLDERRALFPGVWDEGGNLNPFFGGHVPFGKQLTFLGLHKILGDPGKVFEALYGGAAGGGKSDTLLMAIAQYAWTHGDFAAACFRRTNQDLINPGALLDRAKEWWIPSGVSYNGSEKIFTFPSGAKVKMSHMSLPEAHLDHQGSEYHMTVWDELTQHPQDRQYLYVTRSRVRRKDGCKIPLRSLSGSNPGGPGHVWVKQRFIGGIDPATGKYAAPLHPYVPASVRDNPYLDIEAYMETLTHLHPTTREQLLNGDWEAREPGDYFRREWFGELYEGEPWIKRECRRIRWWDLAASEKPDACRTAGVLMARNLRGLRMVEHAIAFRLTPGARDDAIVQQAQLDGRHVTVGIEIEGGSGGIAQFEALAKRLRRAGFRVVGARPGQQQSDREKAFMMRAPSSDNAKAARADPVASCLERGYRARMEDGFDESKESEGIRLRAGPWTADYLDELEGFPEAALMDLVDATSGAWAYLESHPAGNLPLQEREKYEPAEWMNVHPADRPDQLEPAKNRAGKWRI